MTEQPASRAWTPLDAIQRRVLGVLVEKAKTTPAGYPMTVNAIVTGCTQKSNRAPLMSIEAFDVEKALGELCEMKAASEIDWMGRALKYKHHVYEWLGVDKAESAVMTELLLRGEQQLGELRSRAARMEPIADLAALKPIVEALVSRGLMIELTPPGRGQIVSHNLYLEHELAELRARVAGGATGHGGTTGGVASVTRAQRPDSELAAEVAALRSEVAELRERIAALEAGPGRREGETGS